MIMLLQYFGWRCGQVLRLETDKATVRENEIAFGTTHCKGKNTVHGGKLPTGHFRLASHPARMAQIQQFVQQKQEAQASKLFVVPETGTVASWFT